MTVVAWCPQRGFLLRAHSGLFFDLLFRLRESSTPFKCHIPEEQRNELSFVFIFRAADSGSTDILKGEIMVESVDEF